MLRVITRLVVSGPSTHVLLADRGLQARGWQTLLVHGTVEPDEAEIGLDDLGIPTLRVATMRRAIRPIADAQSFASLVRIIRRYQPDIVHTHQSKAGLLVRSAAMLTAPNVRRIHTFHGTIFGGYFGSRTTNAIVRAEQFLGHHTHQIIALSDLQRAELIDHQIAPVDRISVVPLGLDLARFAGLDRVEARRRLGVPADVVAVVWLGRLAPIKRVDRLIDAFAAARSSNPDSRLYIVGDGARRPELEGLAAAHGITSAVKFVGWSSDAPSWYAAADLVALTSEREGTPLSLIEAGAAGRPVLATDVGGVRDVVVDGVTGWVVPLGDPDRLAIRLRELLADPATRVAMGAAASSAVARFAAERLVDDLDRLYRSILPELPERNGIRG